MMPGLHSLSLALKTEEERHKLRNCESPEPKKSPYLTASKKIGSQSYNHRGHAVPWDKSNNQTMDSLKEPPESNTTDQLTLAW